MLTVDLANTWLYPSFINHRIVKLFQKPFVILWNAFSLSRNRICMDLGIQVITVGKLSSATGKFFDYLLMVARFSTSSFVFRAVSAVCRHLMISNAVSQTL